jgi:hypothetical protein
LLRMERKRSAGESARIETGAEKGIAGDTGHLGSWEFRGERSTTGSSPWSEKEVLGAGPIFAFYSPSRWDSAPAALGCQDPEKTLNSQGHGLFFHGQEF